MGGRDDRGDSTFTGQDMGEFQQMLNNAEQNGDREAVAKYTLLLATQKVKDKSHVEALKILNKNNTVFMIPDTKRIVCRIAADLFAFESNYQPNLTNWKLLRES